MTKKYDLLIQNILCVDENGSELTDIAVHQGLIQERRLGITTPAEQVIDGTGLTLMPGIIDSQVHFREPGLTHKEDLFSGSLSAASGGVTTFLEMPNTKPSTTTIEALNEKIEIARKNSHVDFGFFIGATIDNLEELKKAHGLPGCCGIKIFLGSSTGSLLLDDETALLKIFQETTLPISIHSEDENIMQERIGIRDVATTAHAHPDWRNVDSALTATKKIVRIARSANRKIHILHLSTGEEALWLQDHRDICTLEVTPQHLTLFAPDCYDRLGTLAQMNPPIREERHKKTLWEVLQKRGIDIVASDHAPHTMAEKELGYPKSPSGMPGVQTLLPVMLSHVADKKLSLQDFVRLTSSEPARLFKLKGKGQIKVGYDADMIILDFNQPSVVVSSEMKSKVGWTPFEGLRSPATLKGTYLRGQLVPASPGLGRPITS